MRALHLFQQTPTQLDPQRVAVVFNAQARQVNKRLVQQAMRLVGREHVFYSHSLAQAEAFTRHILQRGYGTVVCGGGDGTLMSMINLMQHHVDATNAWRLARQRRYGEQQKLLNTPRLAFLSLGTGNGLRHVVGAHEPLEDLQRIVNGRVKREHKLRLIYGMGRYFTFGGLGLDSMLLNDFQQLKRQSSAWLQPLRQSLLGYFIAALSKTLPRALRQTPLQARLVARGHCFFVDPQQHDTARQMPANALLYEGPVSMVGVGTTPYYGYGLRIFPFADAMPSMMHLRVASLSPLAALYNLPQLWRGSYRDARTMHDFLCQQVSIQLSRPTPFQASGDTLGHVQQLDLKITNKVFKLVDLSK